MPRSIGAVLSAKMASIVELSTVLSIEDVYIVLEVLSVDAHNREVLNNADGD